MSPENPSLPSPEHHPLSINFAMATARREQPPKDTNEDSEFHGRIVSNEIERTSLGFAAFVADAASQSGLAKMRDNQGGYVYESHAYMASLLTSSEFPRILARSVFNSISIIKRRILELNDRLISHFPDSEATPQGHRRVYENSRPITTLAGVFIPEGGIQDEEGHSTNWNAVAVCIGDSRVYTVTRGKSPKIRELFKNRYDAKDHYLSLALGMNQYTLEEGLQPNEKGRIKQFQLLHLRRGMRVIITSDGIDREVIEEINNRKDIFLEQQAQLTIQLQRERHNGLRDDASVIIMEIA